MSSCSRHFMWLALITCFATSIARAGETGLTLRITGPDTELTTGSEFDSQVLFDSELDNVQGWSFAVAHDENLALLSHELGETTLGINGGEGPQFLVVNDAPNVGTGIVMAAVLSFTEPVSLSMGEGYEFLRMRYQVLVDPVEIAEGDCEPVVTQVAFSDNLGDPPISNVVTVLGETLTPTLVNAEITVRCPGTLEITRCEGDTDNVYLEWASGAEPDWAFLALYRDGEILAMLDPDATNYDDLDLEPGDYTYTLATIVLQDPATPILIFATCTATVIPVAVTSIEPTLGYFIGGQAVTIRGTAFTASKNTVVSFTGAKGEEPLILTDVVVVNENELTAVTPRSTRLGLFTIHLENERGFGELPDAYEYGFIRGEINADGEVDISDAINVLDFLFLGEGDAPICLDAADVTDDGLIDISDGIRVLSFLFLGFAAPPAPFPEAGQDPTADDFGCLDGA